MQTQREMMLYRHDTGEDRPLIEICDECDSDPERCGCNPTDCEEVEQEIADEKAFDAYRKEW